jgi:hypothetical protein
MNRRACALAAFVLVAAVVSACGGGSSASRLPHCVAAPTGIGPDASPTVQTGDSGKTICLATHKLLTVFLYTPAQEDRWGPITTDGGGVLEPRGAGSSALPLGVTAAVYQAARKGTARLISVRRPCTPPATTGCDAAHHWTMRVIVR